MNEIKIVQLLIYTFFIKVNGFKGRLNNKKFRIQVEGIDNQINDETYKNYDNNEFQDNFMSLMVENAKEIFESELQTESPDIEDDEEEEEQEIHDTKPQITDGTIPLSISRFNVLKKSLEDKSIKDSISASLSKNFSYEKYIQSNENNMLWDPCSASTVINEDNETHKIKEKITKDFPKTCEKKQPELVVRRPKVEMEASKMFSRSCIRCNNLASEDCNEPMDKLTNSVQCDRSDDMCYSRHTPFGIIDRGCFSPHYNLTTYVCSCNLCNNLPISEMPHMFINKKQWMENVIAMTRMRQFRKSVYKNMSCLKCEVNTTLQDNAVNNAYCLEGNLETLPVVTCDQTEVCAIKSLRAEGYIWRGCLKAPLYNYWWDLCNHDLCNGDKIISPYDLI